MVVAILQAELDGVRDAVSVGEPSAQTERRDVVQRYCGGCKQCRAEDCSVYHVGWLVKKTFGENE